MNRFARLAIAAGLVVIGLPAFAQLPPPVPPVLENRIPAPQLPAVTPPVINGPLSEGRDPPDQARCTIHHSSTHSAIGLPTA
jgi:hypothetical protein